MSKSPSMTWLWWGAILASVSLLLVLVVSGCQGSAGERGQTGAAGSAGPPGAPGTPGTSVGVIQGKVVSADTNKGVNKAQVVTSPATVAATADAQGNYKIENVPVGIYAVKGSGAGYNAASVKVSVTAGKSAAANLALKTGAPFSLITLRGVGYRTNGPDKYPDGKLRLTTHYALEGGPLTHGENLVATSGLPNVAVGSYVYLEGKDKDAAEKKIASWVWKVTGPGEAEVAVENSTTRTPRFKADKIGKYEVVVNSTNEEDKKLSSKLEVYAGTYVGAQACISCHSGSVMPDTVSEWQQTGHATKLIDTFASYTPARDYCIACHTTGYDERDKAGGFDDLARQAGWDASKKSVTAWLIEDKWTVEKIMNSPMGKLANVQCESCHGPGLIHEGIKTAKETGALMSPSACTQCHPQEMQWRNSGHSKTGAKEMHMAEGTSCVECHTGQGFVEVKIRGKKPVFPSMATAEEPATLAEPSQQPPVACAACHDPHAFSEPFKGRYGPASRQLRLAGKVTMPSGVTVDAHDSAGCVTCHANKRNLAYKADYVAGKKGRGAHDNTQADVFYGATPAVFDYGKGAYASSVHPAIVKEGCVQCHMAANPTVDPGPDRKTGSADDIKTQTAGAHSFNVVGDYNGKRVENLGACTSCHKDLTTFNRQAAGDFDGDGRIEGVQDEVKGLLELLAAQLPKDPKTGAVLASPVTTSNTNEAQRRALWNYWVIANDGSRGVHNTAFAVQVLQRTYKEVTGKDVGTPVR